ncbi:hypothetical protein [Armatimonas rosea]|uniref:Uncharacterized protein n=1 Tax=Armatimonas rosea TaxID=685828 RepID=A0A7W9SQL3_ARMRO|nr:hypothetical protein [Armatimonas rosea]MBB6051027.1 hypothetical protein [Armatimonas rosea]
MTLTREATALTPDAFEARFSDLVELICDAAQLGHPKPFMEAQYTLLKAWMHDEFPRIAEVFSGVLQKEFESLYQPESLASLLAQDSGALMVRLLDTQAAIVAWKNTQAN